MRSSGSQRREPGSRSDGAVTRLGMCAGCFRHFAVAELKRGRCRPCRARQQQAKDQRRGTASQRGYGADWRKLRAQIIAAHPYCSACGHPGSKDNPLSVDHILQRQHGGSDDRSNLRVLCSSCNKRRPRGARVASKPLAPGTTAPEIREKNVSVGPADETIRAGRSRERPTVFCGKRAGGGGSFAVTRAALPLGMA
jgi:5-methylcytosine-specific restriction enzyme A